MDPTREDESGPSRGRAMERRVVGTARQLGVAGGDLELLSTAHRLAMGPRIAALPDDHHPDYLHPGRTTLILLDDLALPDPEALAAAMLVESERADLRVPLPQVQEVLGSGLARLREAVPVPGGEEETELVEALVTAPGELQLVALAERLDHLRHAHLWEDPERRREAHQEALDVYLPVAERLGRPVLVRRYRWWCRMFGERWLS